MIRSRILGLGKALPDRVVSNFDLEKLMDTSDEWIRQRSGISERRHIVPGEESTSGLATKAAQAALDAAGLKAEDLDLIVAATLNPDHFFPGIGVFVQEALGCNTIGALDIRTQCTGFVYGLSVADQFIRTGTHKHVLVVGAEVQSTALDMTTRGRDVAVLFGDGAGAAILGPCEEEGRGVLDTRLHSEGKWAKELWLEAPSALLPREEDIASGLDSRWFPVMNGRKVFTHAVRRFSEAIGEGLEATGFGKGDIDLLVPHQANLRITEAIGKALELTPDQVYSNIHRYGNTTAASIPIALTEAVEEGRIKDGDLVVLAAFGSGFTWGSAVIRW
jgi:3-oxoacyl-[acyl-carrier-protein] synthase III